MAPPLIIPTESILRKTGPSYSVELRNRSRANATIHSYLSWIVVRSGFITGESDGYLL